MTLSVRSSLLLLLAVGFGACTPGLFPVYSDETVVYDSGLVGDWVEEDHDEGDSIWRIERRDDSSYHLYIIKDGDTTKMVAHLAEIGSTLLG